MSRLEMALLAAATALQEKSAANAKKIRELVADDADNKTLIKAAIKKVDKTAERAGDFEDSPEKLQKLLTALEGIGGAAADDDDDVL